MWERSLKLWLSVGKQPETGAWVTGSCICCQVQCMLGQRAVVVCLPGFSWDGGMEQVKWRKRRSETEKKRDGDRWVVVTWCQNVAAFHLKLFQKLYSEVWEVWMCHGVCVCACVFSFQKRGQVCSIGLSCAFSLWVWVCVCRSVYTTHIPTHMPTQVCLNECVVSLCRSRC